MVILMNTSWNVWATGSNDMSNISPTTRLNDSPIEAPSFSDAVKILAKNPAWEPWIKWNDALGEWTMWACRLFPDQESAKAVFGY